MPTGQQNERRLPSGLSPSTMDLYDQCPKRFEIQKIDGGYEPSGRDALLGTFVHRVLELVMQKPPEERTLEGAKDDARLAWAETAREADFILLGLSEEEMKKFRWAGWTSVCNYFEMQDPQEIEVAATEEYVSVEVEGVSLRGIIDRLEREGDALVVSDYKNGKVPAPKYRASKWEQLNFYAVMLEALRGERPSVGRLIFTAHREILETEFTDRSTSALRAKVVDTWANITTDFEGRGFKTKPQPLCGWCPALATCPDGMAFATMHHRKGRLKTSAPGYALVAFPKRS